MNLKSLKSPLLIHPTIPLKRPSDLPEGEALVVPDLVYPLTGWKIWRIFNPLSGARSGPILCSVILDTVWIPRRRVVAQHDFDLGVKCRGLVADGCSCGIYAFKDFCDALNYMAGIRGRWLAASLDVAFGRVSLWGRVVECERGYRAQYAYPSHLYLPATASRQIMTMTSKFGVPVGIYDSDSQEEMIVSSLSEPDHQWLKTIRLKRSGRVQAEGASHQVAFYDQEEIENLIGQAR